MKFSAWDNFEPQLYQHTIDVKTENSWRVKRLNSCCYIGLDFLFQKITTITKKNQHFSREMHLKITLLSPGLKLSNCE